MEFDLKSMCKLKTATTCHPLSSKINCSEFLQVCLNGSDEPNSNVVTAGFSVGEVSALIFSGALSFEDGRYL